ncbi:hypothetical protein DENIS_4955 [Desulfonema ishimotonii]|uniref:Uncharacterized protein n=1 Tax=Desulfonema ishimotonii TaxID=45657 RepID=A0A401G4A2_9BACT|nr:hypothetical protein DENIS_4955 [Desulfonema ishimotonii]
MGRDTHGTAHRLDIRVSIHAPAWGATASALSAHRLPSCFNPRARMGRDIISVVNTVFMLRFNPRARMGRDIGMSWLIAYDMLFQSTRPHGARHQNIPYHNPYRPVSIHAPAWGAT